MPPFPFTVAELFLALSMVAPEAQARQLAEGIVHSGEESLGWSLSRETFALLSLASPELEAKVDQFLRQYWPEMDRHEWLRLRVQIQQAISSGEIHLMEEP
jgi:hypothetical protein